MLYGATRGREVTIKAFPTREELVAWVEGQNGNAYVLADNDPILGGLDLQVHESAVKIDGVIQVPEPIPEPVVEEPEVPDIPVEPEPEIEPVEELEPEPEHLIALPEPETTPEPVVVKIPEKTTSKPKGRRRRSRKSR